MKVITSLKDLPLTDFIDYSAYEKKDAIVINKKPEYSEAENRQIEVAWMGLLSEYYLAKQDARAARYIELFAEIKAIEFRNAYIDFLCAVITECYNPEIAKVLNTEFPRFKFAENSYKQDIIYARNSEKGRKIKYDQCKQEFDKLEAENEPTKLTPKQREHSFYQSVITINNVLKGSYEVRRLSTLEYALLLRSFDEYVANAERQTQA